MVDFALNLPLAALGSATRVKDHPWIPIEAAAKAPIGVGVSAWYFYQMPAREKAWCGFCARMPDAACPLRQSIG